MSGYEGKQQMLQRLGNGAFLQGICVHEKAKSCWILSKIQCVSRTYLHNNHTHSASGVFLSID